MSQHQLAFDFSGAPANSRCEYRNVDVSLLNGHNGVDMSIRIDFFDTITGQDEDCTLSVHIDRVDLMGGKMTLLPRLKKGVATATRNHLDFLTIRQVTEIQAQVVDLLESFLPR